MSKGLEALDRIGKVYYPTESRGLYFTEDYGCDFDIIEKYLKALDIIKKKQVDVGVLITDIIHENRPKEGYNCCLYEEYQLTQEEFDLLKEVLW